MTYYSGYGGWEEPLMDDALVFECFSSYSNVFDLVMEQGMTQGLIATKIIFF